MRCAVLFSFLVFHLSFFISHAQIASQRFAVYFTNKANNPYSVYNPSAYLSQRAIDRRNRQRINVSENDLPVTPQYLTQLQSTGARAVYVSKWLNCATVQMQDSSVLQAVKALPCVKSVTLIGQTSLSSSGKSKNKKPLRVNYVNQKLETAPAYGMALRQTDIIGGTGLHQKGFTGGGELIAIFDAGFHNADVHPGLQPIFASGRLVATRDYVMPDSSVFNSASHGTECFSVIGAYAPGVMVGTAPSASFVLCHTEDADHEMPIEMYNWAAAAEYADSIGADVISSSLGYTTFDSAGAASNLTYNDLNGHTTPCAIAAETAASKGIIVVNSAGNSGSAVWWYIGTPADADSILAVGAVDANGVAAAFSSHGYSSDGRVKPDVMALGVKVAVANPSNLDYQSGNGTSFAAPAIAGMCACLQQAHPNTPPQEIVKAVRRSADRYYYPNDTYGYGIPNFSLADILLTDSTAAKNALVIYPNPFHDALTVVHFSNAEENATLEVVDMLGREVAKKTFNAVRGYNEFVVNVTDAAAGVYIVNLIMPSVSYQRKAVHD